MIAALLPNVQLSARLRASLASDADEFAKTFAAWREDWPTYEFSDYEFGKDGGHAPPLRNHRTDLWHVHLPPPKSDEQATAAWHDLWRRRRGRRVSNSVLIHAQDSGQGFLLLYIAHEPRGHMVSD